MKKITLDVDALAVASFHPGEPAEPARGTVRGHEPATEYGQRTCLRTCGCPPTYYPVCSITGLCD